MDADEYQHLALRTEARDRARNERLLNAALGLAGESGEVCDLLKKHLMQGHALDETKLAEELGDLLWYVALACDTLELPLGVVMERNVAKLRRRYPDGFSSERSVNRKAEPSDSEQSTEY